MEEEERSDPGKPPVRTGSADSDGHAGEPVRILYVDDDADMAGFFRIYISRLGSFEISHSKNGREALSFLKDGGECDIIISDYDMPGMDGITLLKEIGLLPSPPPFILFTGKGREEVVIEAINNGAAFYLQKGGETRAVFAELVHKIRQAVGKQRAESAVRENEEKFRLLFETARDAILIMNETRIIDANAQASVFFRVDYQTLTGLSILDLSPECQPDELPSRDRFMEILARVRGGEHPFITWRHRRPDGSLFDAESSLNSLFLDGKFCIQVVIRDITDRLAAEQEIQERTIELSSAYEELMAAEEEQRAHVKAMQASQILLAESERRYRELTDLLPLVVYECDCEGRLTYANRQAFETFGYPPGFRIQDLRVQDFIVPAEWDAARELMASIIRDGRCIPHEYHAIHADGTIFPVMIYSSPILDDGRFTGLRGVVMDITDQKRSEEALRRSEEKYRTLIDHIQDGVFIIQGGVLQFANPAFASILGSTVGDLTGRKMRSLIAPEDREMVADRHRRRLRGDAVPTRYEFRMLHADGETRILVTMDIGVTMFQGEIATIGTIRDVTAQREAEAALRESERRLADVIDFLPDATMVIDNAGVVIAWNRAMEDLTGLQAAEIVGTGDFGYAIPFYGERRPILVDLALKADEQIEERYEFITRSGDRIIGEAFMSNMEGGTIYLWGAATPLRDSRGAIVGAIESIRDITERRRVADELERAREDLEMRVADRTAKLTEVNAALVTEVMERRSAEAALRESEERYRRVVELSPDAIFVLDGSRVVFVNPAGVHLLGAPDPLEVTGRDYSRFIRSDLSDRPWFLTGEAGGTSPAGTMYEEEIIRTDGSVIFVEVSSAPIVIQGRPAVLIVARDITQRRYADEQLRRYAEEMSQKNEELDFLANQLLDVNLDLDRRVKERTKQVVSLMKQKDDFITQLGHDLKTPLTPLRALLPMLIEEEEDPDTRDSLVVLLRSVHVIQEQTEKILTIARLTRDEVAVNPEPVAITACIAESVQRNWLTIQQKGIDILVDIPDSLIVQFSETDGGVVFDNLISNAVKYSVEKSRIRITSETRENCVCFFVADHGIGLTPGEAAHVFDEFYMADPSRHDRGSSGLGLAIVRRIVSLYGGTVHVWSEGKGKGSTFSFCLPAGTGRDESGSCGDST